MTYSSEWPCLFRAFPALSVALCVFSLMSVSRAVKHTEANHGVNPTASSSSPSRWSSFTHSFHRSLSRSPYRDLKTVCLPFRWPSSSFGSPLRMAGEKEWENEWLDLNDWDWLIDTKVQKGMNDSDRDCTGLRELNVLYHYWLQMSLWGGSGPSQNLISGTICHHTIPQIHRINLQWKGSPWISCACANCNHSATSQTWKHIFKMDVWETEEMNDEP